MVNYLGFEFLVIKIKAKALVSLPITVESKGVHCGLDKKTTPRIAPIQTRMTRFKFDIRFLTFMISGYWVSSIQNRRKSYMDQLA